MTPPSSNRELPAKWTKYVGCLLNYDNGHMLENLPLPAVWDLPVDVSTPTCDVTMTAIQGMNNNKAGGLDSAITAEAIQGGGKSLGDMIHNFCMEVFKTLTPPCQWTTNLIIPLPKKGDLSLMTNYRGITLMSIVRYTVKSF